jgi:DNA polymerase I-like protein with 3'-5' exonuclease and polymerase domains
MIYLVTGQKDLFGFPDVEYISVEQSINMMESWDIIQYDSETDGRDAHLCNLLCTQFGDIDGSNQIVVDTTTINIKLYKDILEKHYIVGQNLKFDLQFLYKHDIIPRRVYDTMIVEQFLYLGYPAGSISYSLASIAERYLGIYIDKSIRGEIIWRGLDYNVIQYAANDVKYLGTIMHKQLDTLKTRKNAIYGARLECNFVPVIAYLEWCGIKLDEEKWRSKMQDNKKSLEACKKNLDSIFISRTDKYSILKKYITINRQGDLFLGFDLTPKVSINWDSSQQVSGVMTILGFNTSIQDKETGDYKDSVLEKHLKGQVGIDDEFLKAYFAYKEQSKECSTYGQSYLDAVNPRTGRIYTVFKQLGAASGRMACGSRQNNTDLAKEKHLHFVGYPQLQNLPADEQTRSAFVAEDGNLFCSCDYSALESRLGADIYNEKAMLDEFLYGSGDMHSLCTKLVFYKELEGIDVKDVKKKRPDLRTKVKSIEFSQQFGGTAYAVAGQLGCSIEEAQKFVDAYSNGFKGITSFKKQGSAFVRNNGYVVMSPLTGHCMHWHDWKEWKEMEKLFSPEFWEEYRTTHRPAKDAVYKKVKEHFQASSKWDRMSLNAPTQGQGIVILKYAMTDFFNWIVDNNLFNKVLICNLVHDEACVEYPKDMPQVSTILKQYMESAASIFCRKLPIPASPEVGTHWIH